MIGKSFKPRKNIHIGRVGKDSFKGYQLIDNGILTANYEAKGSCTF